MRSEVVIAVVGAAGSGRTTVIKKGLKANGLSDVHTTSVPYFRNGVEGVFECMRFFTFNISVLYAHFYAQDSYRVGHFVGHDSESRIPLRVLEVDIASLDLSQTKFKATQVCPDGVPPVDGLVICYDASREQTFSYVADLICECQDDVSPVFTV